ncbi:hypothetical protein GCM10010434_073400 [Winogradskya humida]
MGRELAASSEVFAARLAECSQALAPYGSWSLFDDSLDWDKADVVQPLLWSVMVSLAAVWEAAGVVPDAVVGHSQGEIAAAVVAGMLSLEDGAKVVALRSQSLRALAGAGGMLSIQASAESVEKRLDDRLSLAVVNGPAAVVVSGEPDALLELKQELEAEGVRARMVAVDYASHGPQVESLKDEILTALDGVTPRTGRVPMVSAMTGEVLTGTELDAAYWYASLRTPVQFERAVRVLAELGHQIFIEVTPHPVMLGAITDIVADGGVCGTLRRDDGGVTRLVTSFAEAFVQGATVDWTRILPPAKRVDLPTYAFRPDRYWPDAAVPVSSGDPESLGMGAVGHPLLGATVELAGGSGLVCTGRLSLRAQPWLADHAVGGVVLLPGTGFVELAVRAGDQAGCGTLDELTLQAPLVVPADGSGVQVQVVVGAGDGTGRREVQVFSRTDAQQPWTQHATGTLAPGSTSGSTTGSTDAVVDAGLSAWPPRDATAVDIDGIYEAFAAGSLTYGPAFRGVREIWQRGTEVFAEVALPEGVAAEAGSYGLHPALMDAVLQASALLPQPDATIQPDATSGKGEVRLPFAWTGVELHAGGAAVLRARLSRDDRGNLTFVAADATGAPVISVSSLSTRPVTVEQLQSGPSDALYAVDWLPVTVAPAAPGPDWALLGTDHFGTGVRAYDAGTEAPGAVLACITGEVPQHVAIEALELVQRWLADDRLEPVPLIVLTRGAVPVVPGEGVSDLAAAAAWGLLRSAQSENPGRIFLVDLPATADVDLAALAGVPDSGEPELAFRGTGGALGAYGRRLVRPSGALVAPEGPWRLTPDAGGSLHDLTLAEAPEFALPLEAGHVRVGVRVAGLNFRDVLIALGMYPGGGVMGSEIAGVVLETGPGVTAVHPGDRVMGIAAGGFGPVVTTDARQLVRVPDGWSFATAASVPVAFLTAWYALVNLADARAGQKVLIHAAAGGVGSAAVQIARHLGLEVYATASPAKWPALLAAGLDEQHIASSRDARFEPEFLAATGGRGVDIVINSLAGDLIDASLRLLPAGGAFIEMGKTDLRDPGTLPAGLTYRPFDLGEAGPDQLGAMLATIVDLLSAHDLNPLPLRAWDVRRAPEAFRFMSQARHTGKLVLTMPAAPMPAATGTGTTLITGGTGTLGALVARHRAATGSLVLTSRSGPGAANVAVLSADLAGQGATVRVLECDAADRDALSTVLAGISDLTSVVHTAGILDDGVIASLTPERVATVMRPKADGAWNLHELTQRYDLTDFVLFSSAASATGAPGQGNYVAANAFLDALAAERRATGLPGTSLGWGMWAELSALTGQLSDAERARISRGVAALSAEEGLALFDLAVSRDEAVLVPARFDLPKMRAQAAQATDTSQVPALWRALIHTGGTRRTAASGPAGADSLHRQLAPLSAAERIRLLSDLIRTHVAAVLGHTTATAIEATRNFTDLGFDSLTAVELRNRLNGVTGLRLPATLVFDYPNLTVLAGHLRDLLVGDDAPAVDRPPAHAVPVDGDPIVIVGMACRFPRDVTSPDEFWQLLAGGTDAVSGFPDDRGWDADNLYHPDPDHTGTIYTRSGGFMGDASGFDAGFFGISPREALAMDPQQRLLLEVSWEAIERSGIEPGTLRGSPTGVFVGGFASGYGIGVAMGTEGSEGHLTTGFATSVLSGRVSYTLGLEGPAVTVDTACSSSLVALHLAAQALRSGECSLALAGGATVISTPDGFVGFSQQRGLAEDGRSKAFSAGADGMGMAEGAGVLVVERLSDARRNGHPVLAVVRSSAVNQDGASNGMTAPNGPSQQRVIRAALATAGLSTNDVDAVEAHGTGTTLGDPIEAQALLATYGQGRPEGRPLWLGSVKSNIGHTQAAAGVAGVMKMVLALRNEQLPRTLHAADPSPHVDWTAGDVRLLNEPVPWPSNGRVRRAGVSSFGISGTNAHIILEEAPAEDAAPVAVPPARVVSGAGARVLSSRSAAGLADQADRLRDWVSERPELDPADVAWSLATTRSVFEHRAVVVGDDQISGVARADARTVFVFPGQGSQWIGMGRELADSSEVFAARLAECSKALAPYGTWSLFDDSLDWDKADVVQPLLWSVMVSLAAVWEAAGVHPDAVVGHSQGEIAAAVVAGMLSLEDGAKVVALRSQSLRALAGAGGMLSIQASAESVEARLDDRVSLAVVNGPAAVVVSGEPAALLELKQEFDNEGVRARMVAVDYASHGPQVESLKDEILTVLAGVTPRAGRVPMVSAMTGEVLTGTELDAAYWYASLRAPVQFERAVRVLAELGHELFVEVTPHPVLLGAVGDIVEDGAVFGTLRRDDGGVTRLVTSFAEAFVRGATVDWTTVLPAAAQVELPTYAFRHERFWPDAPRYAAGGDPVSLGLGAVGHPLLGATVELAGGAGLVCTGRLSLRTHPWLADHAVGGVVLLPGTGFVELAVSAGDQAGCGVVEELTLQAPLLLPADGSGVQVQVVLGAADGTGRRDVRVYSRTDPQQPWTEHAGGTLAPAEEHAVTDAELAVWPPRDATVVDIDGMYEAFAAGALEYGPSFQGVRAAWRRGADVYAEVALPDEAAGDAGSYGLHPALLDAVLQASALLPQPGATGGEGLVRLPFAWTGVQLHAGGAGVLRARLRRDDRGDLTFTAADTMGAPVISVASLVTRPVAVDQLRSSTDTGPGDALFAVDWVPVSPAGGSPAGALALLGANPFGIDGIAYAGIADIVAAAELPRAVLVSIVGGTGDVAQAARQLTAETLALLQEWLAEDRLETVPLVVLTRGAVAALPGEGVTDLAAAAVWGLLRSAQAENPGRLILADVPATGVVDPDLLDSGEPELALRDAIGYGRRLIRPAPATVREVPAGTADSTAVRRAPAGTALITGGTGTLGALVARHLAVTGRAGTVVLLSRSGPWATGAATLAADLAALGTQVRIVAGDAADRDALAAIVDRVPPQSVFHTAGVIDDGVIASLTPQRLDAVMRPKTDAAWHLHELTADLDLDHFVLFSSAAATFGAPGQGNYVAANTFLDALASYRRAAGQPATSLAWGLWADVSGLTGQLSEAERARMGRNGITALTAGEALALMDTALTRDDAMLVAARLDLAGLRGQAARGAEVPALWKALAPAAARRTAASATAGAADSLRQQLSVLAPADGEQVLLELTRTHIAAVLGHTSGDAIEPARAFSDLGFDSLTAVELRNRLTAATGLRLPATLVFDYPSPVVLATHLRSQLIGELPAAAVPATPALALADDPIAIVGMSCRFPGGVTGPEDLWRLLDAGEDAISEFPADRGWDLEALYNPDATNQGTSYTQSGGFVTDASAFDAGFFEISPREALAMDPQQRLLLELSWEAFERAGIDPATLRGSQTGAFVGGYTSGYEQGVIADGTEVGGHLMTGVATSILSGRLSYAFGLEGPAMTVDTACSSALVALHLAAQALQAGECSLALVGGVTVMATPGTFIEFSRQRGLSTDGRCKAFSADADGTGFSEGAGMLVVERLSQARRNGHQVLAVLRGSALNQDGASNGLTAPNGPAQQRVIRSALANARLSAGDVDVVEAHGTGTTLGDPIEAQALLATYGQDRPEDQPLWLGSVKSNIGHTQAAAGVAGVIKMVLALRHGRIPQTLHADEPSPHVDWTAGDVRLLTESVPWPATGRPRRAGVSSFGISGTNAHVIVEEAPPVAEPGGPAPQPRPQVVAWTLSARTDQALQAQATRLREFLVERPELDPLDVALSLATTRTVFNRRAVVLGGDRAGLLGELAVMSAGVAAKDVVTGTAAGEQKLAFVFPGSDAGWPGSVASLLDDSPVFAARMAECEQALAPLVDWSLTEVLRGPAVERVEVLQPVLWAVLVSLAAMWRAAGVHPAAVAGDGPGEVAAAQVAGILTPADAARIAVSLASGSELTGIRVRPGTIAMYSTRDAAPVGDAELDAAWWLGAGDDPQWTETVLALAGAGIGGYVELSPEPVLSDRIAKVLADHAPDGATRTVTGALDRAGTGLQAFLTSLATVHVQGTTVDWAAVLAGGRKVDLPTYAFQRQRYWPTIPVQRPSSSDRERKFWAAVDGGDMSALAGLLGLAGHLNEDTPLGTVLAKLSQWRGQEPGTPAEATEAPGAREWMRQLDGLDPAEQQELMRRLVREGIAEMLGYDSLDWVPGDGDVFEMGMTSMLAVQLRESISERTGVNLPEGFIYDFYSPVAIADFLWAQLSAALPHNDSPAV